MRYEKEQLQEISFPLGGIGSGSIGLAGNGMLVDWEIFNKASKGSGNGYSNMVLRVTTCSSHKTYIKVLNGDLTKDLIGQRRRSSAFSGYGFGPDSSTMCGFPHFRNVVFDGEFPIARLTLTDPDMPGKVTITAFNPFIPGNSDDSSLPAAFFDISYENTLSEPVEATLFFSLQNPFQPSRNVPISRDGLTGLHLISLEEDKNAVGYGDLCLMTDAPQARTQACWYRGGWNDSVTVYWHEIQQNGDLLSRDYSDPGTIGDTGVVYACQKAEKETAVSFRYLLSWNVPNNYAYWRKDAVKEDGAPITWKNYYARLFEDSAASAAYGLKEWGRLYTKTKEFKDALFSSTLDPCILDAVSANLSVLKSPTVLRLEDGQFYGWEGLHEIDGSCEGTCEHVWNYAYALCFLFPDLERSIRELEKEYSTYENGEMQFRMKLPLSKYGKPQPHDFLPALDGQMGVVIKNYREWKISGDDDWLRRQFPTVRKILEYAWSPENACEWDRDHDGVLEGRQHHTLDMELFGPSSWLESMYLAALKAGAEMASYLGYQDKADEYLALFENGKAYLRDHLFNGKWFIQKVNIKDPSIPDHFGVRSTYWNEEAGELKYQIDEGCEIDQMLGQWHADLCGLGEIFDEDQMRTALRSLYQYNVRSMRDVENMWRVFSLNDDKGAVMCTYPQGAERPVISVPYCDETMTGFEYALAGLMISKGMVREGTELVRDIRSRFTGDNRNPWNEFECGSNYARSMASFALLPICSGFTFDMSAHTIGFDPIEETSSAGKQGLFRSFWSLGPCWGTFEKTDSASILHLLEGTLAASHFVLPYLEKVSRVSVDGREVPFTFENHTVTVEVPEVSRELVIETL